MNLELIGALTELEKERGISKDILLEAIEVAIVSAYKRNYGSNSAMSVRVDIDENTGEIHVFSRKVVTDDVTDEAVEISLEEAKEIDPNLDLGDIVEQEVTPRDFGRIAAQTAKQVVIQRIREAERTMVFHEYSNREGDVVTGIVQRQDHRNVIVDLGKVEAVLPASEQIPGERYVPNSRLKFYINEVKQSTKGPQVFLSRTHPGLLKNLFELEVPEVQSGVVEIKAAVREAGQRSKVAVYSRDENVDPVGSCVGARGMRVQAIVSELNGEKIDIVEWVPDPAQFVANALSPADVIRVVLDEENRTARTVVADDQLSLAIGKEGQNARLAARLTGWKIDIKNESKARDLPEFQEKPKSGLELLGGLSLFADQETPEEEQEEKRVDVPDAPPTSEEQSPAETADADKETEQDFDAASINLSNVIKRKSWQERFGTNPDSSPNDGSGSQKNEGKKKKKGKRVINDFSMLDLDDFDFKEDK